MFAKSEEAVSETGRPRLRDPDGYGMWPSGLSLPDHPSSATDLDGTLRRIASDV